MRTFSSFVSLSRKYRFARKDVVGMGTASYDTQRLSIPTNFSAQLALAIKVLRPELLIKSPFLCRMIVFNTESGKCQRPTSSVMPNLIRHLYRWLKN